MNRGETVFGNDVIAEIKKSNRRARRQILQKVREIWKVEGKS